MSNEFKEIHERKIKKLYHKLGLKYNMTDKDIMDLINSPYEFSREKIRALELKTVKTEEEFDKLKTNFIYRYLGKYYVEFKRILYYGRKNEFKSKRSTEDSEELSS
jgi:hypothetical protein